MSSASSCRMVVYDAGAVPETTREIKNELVVLETKIDRLKSKIEYEKEDSMVYAREYDMNSKAWYASSKVKQVERKLWMLDAELEMYENRALRLQKKLGEIEEKELDKDEI